MYDEWVVGRSALRFVDPLHGLAPCRIGAEAVDCLGGKPNWYATRFEMSCSFLEGLEASCGQDPFLERGCILEVSEVGGGGGDG